MLTTLGIAISVLASAPTPAAPVPAIQISALDAARSPGVFVQIGGVPLVHCPAKPGTSYTDQETVVSATNARTVGDSIEADDALLSLPEGSSLKAVFDAERVVTERLDGVTRHTLYKGELRIVDAKGIVRARVSAQDAALQLDAKVEHDEVNFTARAFTTTGHPVPVHIQLNADEAQEEPKHGAIRWQVLQPDESGKPLRMKMQFVYDQRKLCDGK